MDVDPSSASDTSQDKFHTQELNPRSVGQTAKRKRQPSAALLAQGLTSPLGASTPKDKARKQKKDKEVAPEAGEKENSLGVLTKRFLEVASTFPDGVLELNQVAAQLGVSKRRMYDITNVLEGVNLLQKQNKNVVLWKSSTPLTEDQKGKIAGLRREADKMHAVERKLDASIMQFEHQIRQYTSLPSCYVHHSDVRSIPSLSGKMILAVKAARGAEVHIDPAPGQNRMTLRSETEVDVYVLTTDSGQPHEQTMMDNSGYSRQQLDGLSTPQRPKHHGNGLMKEDELLGEQTLGASLVHIADAASNQAPVPLSLAHDPLKASPSSGLLNPPSPISPTRNAGLIMPLDDNFGFGGNIFNSSPTRTSPHLKGIPSPTSSVLGADPQNGSLAGVPTHMLSSTPMAKSTSTVPVGGTLGLLGSPTRFGGLFKTDLDPLSPGPSYHNGTGDESALPGMLNSKALRSDSSSRAGSDGSNGLGLDNGLAGSTLGLATPGTLPSLKSEMSNDSSPFKPTRRGMTWPPTPDVSSTGFEDYPLDPNSPSKRLALTPTSSPEKRQFPFGSPDQLEHGDTFAFFPESSIGLPSRR